MTLKHLSALAVAAAALAASACSEGNAPTRLVDDQTITGDLAATSGDAIATSVAAMIDNQGAASLNYEASSQANATDGSLNVQRSRKCYDAAGAEVSNCHPSTTRKIVTHVTIDGSRSGERAKDNGGSATWSAKVHRVLDDTLVRNFNTAQPPAEVSRTHSGVGSGNDTVTVTDGDFTRTAAEAVTDSVQAVTFNLPRSQNPWPASGKIVRRVSAKITVTKGSLSESRTVNRRVSVQFPADAQGNVVLTIDDKICTLNLVTRRVTNCQ